MCEIFLILISLDFPRIFKKQDSQTNAQQSTIFKKRTSYLFTDVD
jgi:hypothetical protein